MRKLIAGTTILVMIVLVSGCTSVQPPQDASMEMAGARQNVKLYDVMPPYGSPIEQISATACNGTRERATDRLISIASQRGGNGLVQLSCREEGISMACWSSATCTGMAINVVAPPPPPPPPPKRAKPKAKKR
jgi:hypothetical protein